MNPYIVLEEDEDAMGDFIGEVSGPALANFHFRRASLKEVLEG